MKEIQLTKGKVAIVDDEDYDLLSKFKWCATMSTKEGHLYARTFIKAKPVYMHRMILQVVDRNILVDHRNRNTLDNTRANLRACSRGQNRSNSKTTGSKQSKYRGVSRGRPNRFAANISVDKKRIFLGIFESEISAALAYNEAALKHKGEFATLNEIPAEMV